MNIQLFDELIDHSRKGRPAQHPSEWKMFLEICEMYMKTHGIKKPIVVELGVYYGMQRQFYEQFFDAEYIGIDYDTKRSVPDIIGDTMVPETLDALTSKLKGRPINILFIDAGHTYKAVKQDFNVYSPLCSDIVALHDIESGRYADSSHRMVWKFWDELKERSYKEKGKLSEFMFLTIRQRFAHRRISQRLGIGLVLKR